MWEMLEAIFRDYKQLRRKIGMSTLKAIKEMGIGSSFSKQNAKEHHHHQYEKENPNLFSILKNYGNFNIIRA